MVISSNDLKLVGACMQNQLTALVNAMVEQGVA